MTSKPTFKSPQHQPHCNISSMISRNKLNKFTINNLYIKIQEMDSRVSLPQDLKKWEEEERNYSKP